MALSKTLEDFPVTAKAVHFKRNRAYPKTRAQMRQKTQSMFVSSCRLSGKAYAPTQKTTPPLRKRRYSVDVVTEGWNGKKASSWALTFSGNETMEDVTYAGFAEVTDKSKDDEPPIPREPSLALPDPRRYLDLSLPAPFPPNNLDTYLKGNNVILNNEDFLLITDYEDNSWMQDSIVDMALEILSQEYQCGENGIEIMSSMVSFLLCQVNRYRHTDNNNFAGYDAERKRLQDKKFIFLPINDGYTQLEYQQDGEPAGTHWSFVVIDRIRKTASYLDSYSAHSSRHQSVAFSVVNGVQLLLGETYLCHLEENVPHQHRHNITQKDWGPCGPFVYEMIKVMLNYIRGLQDDGKEDYISLVLPREYGSTWKTTFNSRRVRDEIQSNIMTAKQLQIRDQLIYEHDLASIM
jgi:hypothetical protein